MTAIEKYNLLLFNQSIILIFIFIRRIYQKRTAELFTHNRQSVRRVRLWNSTAHCYP
ncbi:MAG: hypothetical protein UW19_C0001G0083 [Candidatus Moranbacteria bacterium GW2011_GWF2_44_10]|nr:MAG: hypothetical protein UW19_C0001G0083 [Candidatus Moranbacteria bacterium GW2011_GWF2_44_10]KKT70850.1 MAG: hypothetical protein UW66_C0036G0011 [Candidatus Moranbacteria bacterium GW2011_GWF1_44_4]